MAKLGRAHVMIAQEMVGRGSSVRQVAAQLGVDESTLRYRLNRPADAADGRRDRTAALDGWDEIVDAVLGRFHDPRAEAVGRGRCSTRMLYEVLAREHGFTGSYQAVRRYLTRRFGRPPVQAVRRVETPPGVQAQHDWFEWEAEIDGERRPVYGLIGTLSHSRASFVSVSLTMTQLAWQSGHLALFARYGGVPLWVRIDNLKTAIARGAGPTGVVNPTFAHFATACGFAIDPCRVRTPEDKGKVERAVRTDRDAFADLLTGAWPALDALQVALDERAHAVHRRRRCPPTGTSVAEALEAERRVLQPLPHLEEPFDLVVARRVSRDCLVACEGRQYSVPFAWVGRTVEVRGTAQHVVIYGGGEEVARHRRQTMSRLIIDPAHYDGPSTSAVLAPTPLGRRARLQLAGLGLPAPQTVARPLDAYLALVERRPA
jgi:transposase